MPQPETPSLSLIIATLDQAWREAEEYREDLLKIARSLRCEEPARTLISNALKVVVAQCEVNIMQREEEG